ncbi:hypothetical protein [Segniliparus rugosus]|uniref:Uncharacterized protein n=1 Tax=Segniliparus rugosus (strain ATCC BAA-974 / DSM 45345 / CCUG 50838 / CIP 108380 / JCM 13579 / CDC 945) TaxID=679197 RepID=E5XNC6_SEGRC|nr:hypothetical protein [Segniliparus rugosus]EFV14135.1 hypothetical protein HMPREF9336_01052 [Segniliparus rugosus ATCC BAA-974]
MMPPIARDRDIDTDDVLVKLSPDGKEWLSWGAVSLLSGVPVEEVKNAPNPWPANWCKQTYRRLKEAAAYCGDYSKLTAVLHYAADAGCPVEVIDLTGGRP